MFGAGTFSARSVASSILEGLGAGNGNSSFSFDVYILSVAWQTVFHLPAQHAIHLIHTVLYSNVSSNSSTLCCVIDLPLRAICVTVL